MQSLNIEEKSNRVVRRLPFVHLHTQKWNHGNRGIRNVEQGTRNINNQN
jgi:hypothetical protein